MLDHLNATIIDNLPSGFFAECANLVPSCGTCNFGRGNTPWETWIRAKGQEKNDSPEIIEQRVAAVRRFLQQHHATHLDCRKSGQADLWTEYDGIRQEITRLLTRAQEISEELRAAVTADWQK